MKILFVYPDLADITHGAYNRGVGYLSSCLKRASHDTALLHISSPISDDEYLARVEQNSPDMVAFSAMTNMFPHAQRLAKLVKSRFPKLITAVGGVHATIAPEEAIVDESFDYVGVGECEEAMVELCDALSAGGDTTRIANIWSRRNGQVFRNAPRPLMDNLDTLPQPDRDIFGSVPGNDFSALHFMASRGCPYGCTYCCNHALKKALPGKYVRFRTPEGIISEVEASLKKTPARHIHFMDDVLTLNMDWLRRFTALYKERIRVPYTCCSRVNLFNDEVARLLKESGCGEVKMGIEAGNEDLRVNVLKRKMTNRQIVDAFRLCRKHKLRSFSLNMLGLPTETWTTMLDTVRLNALADPNYSAVSIFYPFPYTELFRLCEERGFLTDRKFDSFYTDTILNQPTVARWQVKFVFKHFRSLIKLYKAWYRLRGEPRGLREDLATKSHEKTRMEF